MAIRRAGSTASPKLNSVERRHECHRQIAYTGAHGSDAEICFSGARDHPVHHQCCIVAGKRKRKQNAVRRDSSCCPEAKGKKANAVKPRTRKIAKAKMLNVAEIKTRRTADISQHFQK